MLLTLKQVALFYGCSLCTARNRVVEIATFYKLKRNRITRFHLCDYERVSLEFLNSVIGAY